jgi:hypothetical protein
MGLAFGHHYFISSREKKTYWDLDNYFIVRRVQQVRISYTYFED